MARRRTIAANPLDDLIGGASGVGALLEVATPQRANVRPSPASVRSPLASAERVATEATAAPSLSPASGAGVLEVNGIILRDGAGRARAELGVSDAGEAVITLRDGDGSPRLELGVGGEGRTRVVARDAGAEIRVVLDVDVDGRPTLVMGDGGERPRLAMGVTGGGLSFLELLREDGKTRSFGLP